MGRERSLVYGVGTKDADYFTNRSEKQSNGKWKTVWRCPYYERWASMLQRCYSAKFQEKSPTYIGCSVSQDWLLFSNFKSWMEKQDWEGKQLDKDILVKGNKIYSEETCIFVDRTVNMLLTDNASIRGEYLIGVYWCKRDSKFKSKISLKGKKEWLGYFTTEASAHRAYCIAKNKEITRIANEQTDLRLKEALLTHMYSEYYLSKLLDERKSL